MSIFAQKKFNVADRMHNVSSFHLGCSALLKRVLSEACSGTGGGVGEREVCTLVGVVYWNEFYI